MSQSAYILFVKGSALESASLQDVKDQLLHYRDQTARTGEQLDWSYADAAFPYTIETKPEAEEQWFYLKGASPLYRYVVFGTGTKADEDGTEVPCVQIVLPDDSTHGDKAKANEFCRYLAKKWQAQLLMFNGRIMYFNNKK